MNKLLEPSVKLKKNLTSEAVVTRNNILQKLIVAIACVMLVISTGCAGAGLFGQGGKLGGQQLLSGHSGGSCGVSSGSS